MIDIPFLLHFFSLATLIALIIIGVAYGQSQVSSAITHALNEQPQASAALQRAFFIALTINEMAALMGVIMVIFLIKAPTSSFFAALAQWSIVLALGIPSLFIGIASARPLKQAMFSIARQPFFTQKILNIMMFGQTIMQTPILLGFIIGGWLLRTQLPFITNLGDCLKLFAIGTTFGIATIGPTLGLSRFFSTALEVVGRNRSSYQPIFNFIFLSQAFIETPLLFAIFIAGFMSFSLKLPLSLTAGITVLCAGLVMALCSVYTSINSSRSATAAVYALLKNPAFYPTISRLSLFTQALIDTVALYGLIIATIMIALR